MFLERTSSGEGRLRSDVSVPVPRDVVFPFFADARNLQRLTPPWLNFRILTPWPIEMREGALIDYRLSLHGIPIRWTSRITAWEPPHRFVDEQIRGPYRLWRHEHTFEERGRLTVCRDDVTYRAPGGAWVDRLLVRRDVERIFRYREAKMQELFGGTNGQAGGMRDIAP